MRILAAVMIALLSLVVGVWAAGPEANASDATSPWVIGHRGMGEGNISTPENSVPALLSAFEQGVAAVEFDVQLSADHEVVLAHDPRLERMTNGRGCVAEKSYTALKRLSLRDGSGTIHPELGISTLREALEAIRSQDLPTRPFLADIHIKVYDYFKGDYAGLDNGGCTRTDHERLTAEVLKIVGELGLADRVIYTSFDRRVLNLIKNADAKSRVGLLTMLRPQTAIEDAHGHFDFVALNFERFTRADVERAHRYNLGVLIWTPIAMPKLQAIMGQEGFNPGMGVDGVITDNVEGAVLVRQRAPGR
jgi:glycerophosphoryl diester phosphodiesterase